MRPNKTFGDGYPNPINIPYNRIKLFDNKQIDKTSIKTKIPPLISKTIPIILIPSALFF
jgi:hypothetical protein